MKLSHQPGLDGLRGLAVAGVVLFHGGYSWAVGGFLGVSTFFTLSGFLITMLLRSEQAATGRIALGAFWGRRARRLLPAALLTLFGVAALASWLATPEQLAGLRADVLASLFYGANWRFIVDGQSYGDLFAAPSPVLHFWSLAIEEQLYVLFPLLVVVVGRRRVAPVLAGLVGASVALGWVLYSPGGSTSAAYYGTFVRMGELLVGALLAVVLGTGEGHIRRVAVPRTAGLVALVGIVWAWTTVRQDETLLYRGGFAAHAVASALVILVAMQPGPVRWVLSFPPLRSLGQISYGVYLFHWPVFVWWHGAPFVARVTLTLAIATVSYFLLEQPIRRGEWTVPMLAVPAAALVVVGAVVASTLDPPRPQSFELVLAGPRAEPVSDAPVVAMFGDSTALRTGFALMGWGWATGRIYMRDGGTDVGCPLGRGGVVDYVVAREEPEPECQEWPTRWRDLAVGLDAAVIEIGPWDVTDRELDGRWTHIGEPAYDAYLAREMHLAVDTLSSDGALVIWLTSPYIEFGRGQAGIPDDHPISDPERMDRLNALITSVDAARDEMVVLDLVGYLRSLPGNEMDARLRPDGVHFSESASVDLVDWLAPAIIEAVRNR